MADYTTDGLVTEIKRRGNFPSDEQLFTSTGYLDFADEQLQSYIVPVIMEVREEYFVTFKDISVVADQEFYDIPEKAIGMKLRDVTMLDSNKKNEWNLPRYRQEFRIEQSHSQDASSDMAAFYIQGNQVGLFPVPTGTNASDRTLRLYYFRRPGELVRTAEAGKVSAVDSGTNIVTLENVPTAFVAGFDVDVINGRPGFNAIHDDLTIQARSGADITLTTVANISVGDWLTPSGTSPIPQVPVEAHRLLAQDTVTKVMEAIGDDNGYVAASKRLDTLYRHFLTTISPRVEGEPEKIVASDNISHHINDFHFYGSDWS